MKNGILFSIIAVGVLVLLGSCNEDFKSAFGFKEVIQWKSTTVSIDENKGTPTILEVQLVGAQRSSPIDVSFEVTAENLVEGVDYEFPNGKTLTIPANASVAQLSLLIVDNDEFFGGSRTLTFKLTGAGDIGTGTDAAPKASVKVTVVEDDCPIPSLEGSYKVYNRNASPAACGDPDNDDVLTYDATITMVSDDGDGKFTYMLSDVTAGLYPLCYGSAENPGEITTDNFSIMLTAQPDVVYGGDEFNGSGAMDCDGNFTLTWSNGFGDKATSHYTKQ